MNKTQEIGKKEVHSQVSFLCLLNVISWSSSPYCQPEKRKTSVHVSERRADNLNRRLRHCGWHEPK